VLDQWYDPKSISYKVRADDGNLYILRQETSTPDGTWELVSFRGQDRSARCGYLAVSCDPHPPSVECKIQNADDYARNRQNGGGEVGIDQLVQAVEQKPTLVWLDTGFAFEPILEQS
jgi:hypothetical protein